MLTVEQIREKLKDRVLVKVAKQTGVDRNTLSKIARGVAKRPSYSVVEALSEYFEGEQGDKG